MPASITTRRLNFGEMSSKRFLRSVTDVIIPAGGGITTTVNVYDPDKSEQIGTITNDTGVVGGLPPQSADPLQGARRRTIYETAAAAPRSARRRWRHPPNPCPPP
jgi:hypothetical protein